MHRGWCRNGRLRCRGRCKRCRCKRCRCRSLDARCRGVALLEVLCALAVVGCPLLALLRRHVRGALNRPGLLLSSTSSNAGGDVVGLRNAGGVRETASTAPIAPKRRRYRAAALAVRGCHSGRPVRPVVSLGRGSCSRPLPRRPRWLRRRLHGGLPRRPSPLRDRGGGGRGSAALAARRWPARRLAARRMAANLRGPRQRRKLGTEVLQGPCRQAGSTSTVVRAV
mmetsp:Transcript_48657/g.157192  ORF Transcript_48657/g.157192 Transcript_48657/m.157192 type:complete len:225 (+) Transcript_48657:167-841(+)